jgi:hypothetical protein
MRNETACASNDRPLRISSIDQTPVIPRLQVALEKLRNACERAAGEAR